MAPIHYPLLALHTPRRNLYGPKCIYIICYPRRICKPPCRAEWAECGVGSGAQKGGMARQAVKVLKST